MKLRAAILGCGDIGSRFGERVAASRTACHAGAYVACPGVELAALADPDRERLRAAGECWGVEARFASAEELLAAVRPDLVSVCTPDATHVDLVGKALRTPGVRAVLAEKPLATDPAAARELVREAEARGVVLAVNHLRRYSPRLRALRDEISSGRVGTIRRVTGFHVRGTVHNGTHWFDLLRMLVGEPVRVSAHDRLGEPGNDPTLDVELELETGARASLVAASGAAYSLFEMDLLGDAGRVRLTRGADRVEVEVARPSPRFPGYRELVPEESRDGALQDYLLHAVQDLVATVASRGAPACSGHDGLRALQIAVAAGRAAATGATVESADHG